MTTAIAVVAIATPPRYLTRLAKHFEHRVPVQRDAQTARIEFPEGVCTLCATEADLHIRIESGSAEALTRYQDVVARHLRQVAPEETVEVCWQQPAAAAMS